MLAAQAIEVITEDSPPAAGKQVISKLQRADFDIRSKLPTISGCKSSADLTAWLLQFSRSLGFYGARYVHIGTRWWGLDEVETPLRFLTTSDPSDDEDRDWLARDPCAARVQKAFAPFAWSTRVPKRGFTTMQCMWLDRERSRGVSAGVEVPIQDSTDGSAYISFYGCNEDTVSELIQKHAPELAFAAAQFHALAKVLVKPADWAPGRSLNKRDIQVLRLAALGKTYGESAEIMGVSARTVEYHLRRASEKLGAETKIRAVIIAFGMGLTAK